MKLINIFIFFIVFSLQAQNYSKEYLEQLLKKIDESRTKNEGIQIYIKAVERKDKEEKESLFLVRAKGFSSKVIYIEPIYNKDDVILNTKTQTWYYRKGTKNPIPITKKQKLFGLASTGDVLNIAYSLEYDPFFLKEDRIEDKDCVVLELIPKKDQKPAYEKLHLWIENKSNLAIYAEYLTASQKLIKKAYFFYNEIESKPFINQIILIDPMIGNTKTILYFIKPEYVNISDIEFKKEFIVR